MDNDDNRAMWVQRTTEKRSLPRKLEVAAPGRDERRFKVPDGFVETQVTRGRSCEVEDFISEGREYDERQDPYKVPEAMYTRDTVEYFFPSRRPGPSKSEQQVISLDRSRIQRTEGVSGTAPRSILRSPTPPRQRKYRSPSEAYYREKPRRRRRSVYHEQRT